MKHPIPLFLVLAFVLLVACGRSTEPLPAQSIEQPTAMLDRGSATATEGIRIGMTVIPPATWTPTSTKPTKTPAPTWTPLPTNTPESTGTATPPGMALLDPYLSHQIWSSPDKNWFWAYEYDDPVIDEKTGMVLNITHLVTADGQKESKLKLPGDYYENFDTWLLPMQEISYKPIFWLPNDPYVYLVGTGCCVDGQIYFLNGYNLVRLNLNTNNYSIQIPGWKMHHFSFSQNGAYLFDAPLWDHKLNIIRLRDGQVTEINLPEKYSQSGDVSFTKDNKMLALQACVDEPDICDHFALLTVDIETKQYRVVVPNLTEAMGLDHFIRTDTVWASNSEIHLIEEDYGGDKKPRLWIVDIVTGKLIEKK